MDTSAIPLNLAVLYDILLTCLVLLASFWAIPKVIQLFKRR